MAHEFTSDHFHQSLIKPSFPFLDHVFDQNMEEITQFSGITPNTTTTNSTTNTTSNNNISVMDNPSLLNFQTFLPFSSDNFFGNNSNTITPELINIHSSNLLPQGIVSGTTNNSSCVSQKPIVNHNNSDIQMVGNYEYSHESKKRKAVDNFDASESSSGISSPLVSESGIIIKSKNCSGKGKKMKSNNEKDEEKPKDVVHVRARRGQATDSHSLAERVRRGKINERLKCLQDIVPGCYKTMGMAVMLDEIINYVQSLQNQVEFLSMKLTAASTFYDFNSETDAVEKLQRAKVNEAKEMERLIREGYGGFACFHSTWPL